MPTNDSSPVDAPSGGEGGLPVPDLPGAASDVAKKVMEGLRKGIDFITDSLGDLISGFASGGGGGNETAAIVAHAVDLVGVLG